MGDERHKAKAYETVLVDTGMMKSRGENMKERNKDKLTQAIKDLVPTDLKHEMNDSTPIASAYRTLDSNRHNGYKSTSYAMAELVDNSHDARAQCVEIVIFQEKAEGENAFVSAIAVADDGNGMEGMDLKKVALSLGVSNEDDERLRLGSGGRIGPRIGKFGVGMIHSMLSQCNRMDVYSWRDGVENAWYAYLDMNELEKNNNQSVDDPQKHPVPDAIRALDMPCMGARSGTLVVWTSMNRNKRAADLVKNTEKLFGSTYLRWLNTFDVHVTLVKHDGTVEKSLVLPNDPLHATPEETQTPPPFDKEPMFQWLANGERPVRTERGDEIASWTVTCAKKEVYMQAPVAGATPFGKHAAKFSGVVIYREERAIETIRHLHEEEVDRFWSASIELTRNHDEVMGLTNNKQYAHTLVKDCLAAKNLFATGMIGKKGSKTARRHIDEMVEEHPFIWLWCDLIVARGKARKRRAKLIEELKKQGKMPPATKRKYAARSSDMKATATMNIDQEDSVEHGGNEGSLGDNGKRTSVDEVFNESKRKRLHLLQDLHDLPRDVGVESRKVVVKHTELRVRFRGITGQQLKEWNASNEDT